MQNNIDTPTSHSQWAPVDHGKKIIATIIFLHLKNILPPHKHVPGDAPGIELAAPVPSLPVFKIISCR